MKKSKEIHERQNLVLRKRIQEFETQKADLRKEIHQLKQSKKIPKEDKLIQVSLAKQKKVLKKKQDNKNFLAGSKFCTKLRIFFNIVHS